MLWILLRKQIDFKVPHILSWHGSILKLKVWCAAMASMKNEVKVKTLEGGVIPVEVIPTNTVQRLKAMLPRKKRCEDPIERKILKVTDGLLVHDHQTLECRAAACRIRPSLQQNGQCIVACRWENHVLRSSCSRESWPQFFKLGKLTSRGLFISRFICLKKIKSLNRSVEKIWSLFGLQEIWVVIAMNPWTLKTSSLSMFGTSMT